MPPLTPNPGTLPYAVVQANNGTFACFGNGAVRKLANHEIVYLRDEANVRTYHSKGDWKWGAEISKILFGI